MLSPRIETDRLVLRRYIENDIDSIYDLITDKRLQTYIKYPKLTKDEELENIRKWIENYDIDKKEKWVIVLKETNEVIGNIQINDINKKNNYCNNHCYKCNRFIFSILIFHFKFLLCSLIIFKSYV